MTSCRRFPPAASTSAWRRWCPSIATAGTDVGGSAGPAFTAFRSRGGSSDEGQFQVNGFPVGWQGFGISYYVADLGAAEEVIFGLSGGMGEARTGGPTLNVIPQAGRQRVSRAPFFANGANGAMEGPQLHRRPSRRRDCGPERAREDLGRNANIGGPIMRDKLWFFSAVRHQGNRKTSPGSGRTRTPAIRPLDLRSRLRQAGDGHGHLDEWRHPLHLAGLARDRLSFFWDEQKICRLCLGGEGTVDRVAEATPDQRRVPAAARAGAVDLAVDRPVACRRRACAEHRAVGRRAEGTAGHDRA